jgi:hypothetical protein
MATGAAAVALRCHVADSPDRRAARRSPRSWRRATMGMYSRARAAPMTAACAGGRGHGPRTRAEPSMGDGNDDQGDEEPGPVASSTSDATGRDAKHAGVPLRRFRAGEVRWETFLYTLKADPAARQPRNGHRGAGPPPVSLIDRNPPRSRRRSPHQGATTSTPPHDRRGSRTDPPSTSVAQYRRSSLSHP